MLIAISILSSTTFLFFIGFVLSVYVNKYNSKKQAQVDKIHVEMNAHLIFCLSHLENKIDAVKDNTSEPFPYHGLDEIKSFVREIKEIYLINN